MVYVLKISEALCCCAPPGPIKCWNWIFNLILPIQRTSQKPLLPNKYIYFNISRSQIMIIICLIGTTPLNKLIKLHLLMPSLSVCLSGLDRTIYNILSAASAYIIYAIIVRNWFFIVEGSARVRRRTVLIYLTIALSLLLISGQA